MDGLQHDLTVVLQRGRGETQRMRLSLILVYLAELMDSLPSLVADSNATVAMEALSLDFGDDDAVRYVK